MANSNFGFRSVGGDMWRRLAELAAQQGAERRQSVLDGVTVDNNLRAQARLEAEARRQAERDRVNDERYTQERQDRLMAQADARGVQYQSAELDRQRREEDQRQHNLDRADAAGYRYMESEARRQESAQEREDRHRENALQRENARVIAGIQMSGRSGDKPTQGQQAADSFYGRAKDALDVIEDVEDSVGNWSSYWPNAMQSDAGQAFEQAKKQFTEAYLRKDSGAAIGKDEYRNADVTYFPQPGDSAATRKRKREARRKVAETLKLQGTDGNQSGNGRSGNTGRSRYAVTVED